MGQNNCRENFLRRKTMAKEQRINREEKKKPAKTQKEKKAEKRAKHESSDFTITDKKSK
jgi:hypothetical protein